MQDYLWEGILVSEDLDESYVVLFAFFDGESDGVGVFVIHEDGFVVDDGVYVAVSAVKVGDGVDGFAHGFGREAVAFNGFEAALDAFVVVDAIAAEGDGAEGVAFSFSCGDADDDAFAAGSFDDIDVDAGVGVAEVM